MKAKINGVHPIEMQQSVHLIDITIHGDIDEFEIGDVTQELPGVERLNWQAPYDEQVISETERSRRFVFFFHNLDFKKPLSTPCGELPLPIATTLPKRFEKLKYETP